MATKSTTPSSGTTQHLENGQTGRRNEPTDLQSEVSAEKMSVVESSMLMMINQNERDAIVAREALGQSDINYKALVEIFVGRKSSHVHLIQQAYYARFRRYLDQDIISIDPPSPYKKILMALAASHKAHHAEVSQDIAKCDARRLYQTGEGRLGAVDEAVVLEILSKRSIPQLKLTFSSYKHIYGHNYTKSLKNGNYGEFEDALETVVECIYNSSKCSAKEFWSHDWFSDLVCKHKGKKQPIRKDALTRVMLSKTELDMNEMQRIFRKYHGMELRDVMCENIPYGDYREMPYFR